MTTYLTGATGLSGELDVVELRVISNLLQQQAPNSQQQDELRVLRNDQAFELGIVPPIVPGQ